MNQIQVLYLCTGCQWRWVADLDCVGIVSQITAQVSKHLDENDHAATVYVNVNGAPATPSEQAHA